MLGFPIFCLTNVVLYFSFIDSDKICNILILVSTKQGCHDFIKIFWKSLKRKASSKEKRSQWGKKMEKFKKGEESILFSLGTETIIKSVIPSPNVMDIGSFTYFLKFIPGLQISQRQIYSFRLIQDFIVREKSCQLLHLGRSKRQKYPIRDCEEGISFSHIGS